MTSRMLVLIALAALGACATQPRGPVAHSVCVEVHQSTEQESRFVRRKAQEFLQERGFRVVDSACEVHVKYSPFGGFAGQTTSRGPFFISRTTTSWSEEGILAMHHNGRMIIQDQPIELTDYGSKHDLLSDLAWAVVEPVTSHFRSEELPSKKVGPATFP